MATITATSVPATSILSSFRVLTATSIPSILLPAATSLVATSIVSVVTESSSIDKSPQATGAQPKCFWAGHCLGDPCVSFNDCDNDWICTNSVCSICPANCGSGFPSGVNSSDTVAVPPKEDGLSRSALIAIAVIVPVCVLTICVIAGYFLWRRMKAKKSKAQDLAAADDYTRPPPSFHEKRLPQPPEPEPEELMGHHARSEMPASVPWELGTEHEQKDKVLPPNSPVEIDGNSVHRRFSWQPMSPSGDVNEHVNIPPTVQETGHETREKR